MDTILSIKILAGVCGIVLAIGVLKEKLYFLCTFLLRAVIGAILILWLNSILIKQGLQIEVGLNLISLLTSASLGIPGVALLFAISALKLL